MKKVLFLNITYGNKPYYAEDLFLPIVAGGGRGNDILSDNTGDNISAKNNRYGELTAVYWAWKNLKDVEIIGLSHYRRFLARRKGFLSSNFRITLDMLKKDRHHQPKLFVSDVEKYDFVMQHHWTLPETNRDLFINSHHCPEAIEIARGVIAEMHPQALSTFDEYWSDNKSIMWCIFVTKWKNFCHLCDWMFPVLFEIERRLELERYKGYDQRIIAFLYERLINIYLRSEKKTVKEVPVYVVVDERCHNVWLQEINKYIMKLSSAILGKELCLFKVPKFVTGSSPVTNENDFKKNSI